MEVRGIVTRKRFIKLLMGHFLIDRNGAAYVAALVRIDPLSQTYDTAWEYILSWPPRGTYDFPTERRVGP